MDDKRKDDQRRDAEHPRSTTSPPGGKTWEATKPPGQGELDREATEKGWQALDRAAGGH
jgi:hypothetical protein